MPSFARTMVSRVVRAVDIAVRGVATQGLSACAQSQDDSCSLNSPLIDLQRLLRHRRRNVVQEVAVVGEVERAAFEQLVEPV